MSESRGPRRRLALSKGEVEPEIAVDPGNTLGIRKFRFDTAEVVDGQARPRPFARTVLEQMILGQRLSGSCV
jgi:hypothetical protein